MIKHQNYNVYSNHLFELYGEKVYKIPVNLPGTCPNRDGTLATGGCIFCDGQGSGFECLSSEMSVSEQLERNKAFYHRRYNCSKFIAYFQTFSNTYMPEEEFRRYIIEAAQTAEIVGISVSTRPDCLNDDYVQILQHVQQDYGLNIDVEIGLQTVNYRTLDRINRGHSLAEFIDAVLKCHQYDLEVCAHVILNLPWDDDRDAIECAKILSALRVEYVKLHSLYIVKNTELGRMYEQNHLELISLEEYVRRAVVFLRYLDPKIIVQRLIGKGPRGQQYFCNWNTSWWLIKESIERTLLDNNWHQGDLCNYLNGAALSHFKS